MNELEGEINGEYKPKNWQKEANNSLKKSNEPYRFVNKNNYLFLQFFTILFFICLIGIGIFLVYFINDGKLQSIISNNLTCPNIPEIPSCPECPIMNCNPTYNLNNTYTFSLDNETLNMICNST
mgnify:CR=1 FL=1